MPEEPLYRSLLLDFYGELLTRRQRECYELQYNEDLSLSEIAEQCRISRQAAWENIRRALAAMEDLEEKTGLIRRFLLTEEQLKKLRARLEELRRKTAEAETAEALQDAEETLTSLLLTEQGM